MKVGTFRTHRFGMHHGKGIRFDGWTSDAPFENGRLAERGVTEPLADFERDLRQADEYRSQIETWRAAMPPCLARSETDCSRSCGTRRMPYIPEELAVALGAHMREHPIADCRERFFGVLPHLT